MAKNYKFYNDFGDNKGLNMQIIRIEGFHQLHIVYILSETKNKQFRKRKIHKIVSELLKYPSNTKQRRGPGGSMS